MLNRAAERGAERIDGVGRGNSLDGGVCLGLLSNSALPQKVDAAIVRDAKEPCLERPSVVEGVESSIGVEERFLHDVLAIGNRAGHSRTISMQARAKRRDRI